MQCLRKLADSGQAILCTIHQPSSTLFEQFDRLLLLQRGGYCVYFGSVGANGIDVIDYFESHGAPKCPEDANPAECEPSCPRRKGVLTIMIPDMA